MEMEESERKDNLERQDKEAEALSAIYGDDFRRVGDGSAWEILIHPSRRRRR
jgi:hypothetical protein